MINTITLEKKYEDKTKMLNALGRFWDATKNFQSIHPKFDNRKNFSLSGIDEKVKGGKNLTISEAFHGMCYVVAATNNKVAKLLFPVLPASNYTEVKRQEHLVKGTYFLTLMAIKEATIGLTPEEVAGVTAAGMLDIVIQPVFPEITETAGMGGDRGWKTRNVKTINASTLSAIVSAACGYKTMKHGSYGNTSKVGSTDVPEMFGANIIQEMPHGVIELLEKTNFWFSDAHSVKTLHYLSHRLMVETINHVVGPMTPPVHKDTLLYKVMGVNHNVHPKIIAKAYTILQDMGILKIGGVVVIGGVNSIPVELQESDTDWFKEHSFLDEVSPVATIVSAASDIGLVHTFALEGTTAFGLSFDENSIKVPNEKRALLNADRDALTLGGDLSKYLACNTALALWSHRFSKGINTADLKDCADEAMQTITSGKALETLNNYIEISGGKRVCT